MRWDVEHMKLLIVDDEMLTREGLIASVDWNSLGISRILQADDGLNGLEAARAEHPEIILCDVRMPRMDGIRLAERLTEILPDSAVIFMSGYSDKEYLKAAIKLGAVNYVEKPLNPEEIREAVKEARERYLQKQRTRENEAFHSMGTASSLALALTRPYKEQREAIVSMAGELSLPLTHSTSFTAYLVRLHAADPTPAAMDAIRGATDAFLEHRHLRALYLFKQEHYHVFHVYGSHAPSQAILGEADRFLAGQYAPFGAFFAARGEAACGISKAYQSYASAVALMQSAFFFDCGDVLTPDIPESEPGGTERALPPGLPASFSEALLNRDQEGCIALLEQIFSAYFRQRGPLPHQAKDLYYKLFMALQECRQKLQLPLSPDPAGMPQSIMESLERCFTLRELHQALMAGTESFFRAAASHVPEDSTIFLIKDFIARNYSDESLSVREISEHVFLSASYVCTYFKNETGQTLNQYLTAYRIEKAKQLLSDSRYQIADISSKVGYSNGNYFGKSFKKLVGLSPSEYREKMLR